MSCPWQNSNATIKNYSLQIQITKQIALPNPDLSRSLSINSPSANLSKSLILRERREFYAKLDATLILLVNPVSSSKSPIHHQTYYKYIILVKIKSKPGCAPQSSFDTQLLLPYQQSIATSKHRYVAQGTHKVQSTLCAFQAYRWLHTFVRS